MNLESWRSSMEQFDFSNRFTESQMAHVTTFLEGIGDDPPRTEICYLVVPATDDAIGEKEQAGWMIGADPTTSKFVSIRDITMRASGGTITLGNSGRRLDIDLAPGGSPASATNPWIEYVLRCVLPRAKQDEIIGDLLEEYQEDIIPHYGRWAARLWLTRHALSDISAAFHLRRWALVAAAVEYLKRHVG